MDSKQLAGIFLENYFKTMRLPRNDRMQLVNFYSQASSMTYTGTQHTGLKEIS
jgi:hypothetical protein